MMDFFSRKELRELLENRPGPCLSLYMPTQRGEQDHVRWKNLMRTSEDRLVALGRRPAEARELLQPGYRLQDDAAFWRNLSHGVAFFAAPGFERGYRLPEAFAESVTAAEQFHIKPLLPLSNGDGRFYILAISQKAVRLFQGSRHAVSPLDVKGIPASLADALRFDDKEEPLLFHTRPAGGSGSWGAIFHGHGVGIDDHKDDLLRYFQQIDRGLHQLLREEKAPLVLASVDYLQPIYRKANSYPHLLQKGADGHPDRLSAQNLHELAWPLVQPLFVQAEQQALAQYRHLAGTGRTSHELTEIVPAACRGEVQTLFVALDQQRWGRFDSSAGNLLQHASPEAGDIDLLDLAARETLRRGNTVYSLPAAQMPDRQPAAAIYFLPLPKHGKRA